MSAPCGSYRGDTDDGLFPRAAVEVDADELLSSLDGQLYGMVEITVTRHDDDQESCISLIVSMDEARQIAQGIVAVLE